MSYSSLISISRFTMPANPAETNEAQGDHHDHQERSREEELMRQHALLFDSGTVLTLAPHIHHLTYPSF